MVKFLSNREVVPYKRGYKGKIGRYTPQSTAISKPYATATLSKGLVNRYLCTLLCTDACK
jgi:hypothetical protein